MPTGTAGSKGRDYHQNMVHYLAKTITFANVNSVVPIGVLPPGAAVVEVGAVVTTVFDGSSPVVDIGTSDDPDAFATDISLETAGRILDTAINANNDYSASADVTVVADVSNSGATSGSAIAYVFYLIPDR